jgi:hypothetical protein
VAALTAEAPGEVNLHERFTMKIIVHEANGLQIGQRWEDGYINATQMCQAHHKKWHEYLRLPIAYAGRSSQR